jgi:antitoxin (DNA-binding transcriptional repressor) of toxin-antitoxin stability system
MQSVTVQQARKDMSRLLDAVIGGDNIIITRRNKPVANLSAITSNTHGVVVARFQDRTAFRTHLPRAKTSSTELLRQMRDEK